MITMKGAMSPRQDFPVIAIIGRPNVGKSTLFNRLIGKRQAVVSPLRGTTRDRLYAQVTWRGHILTLVDTGGLELAASTDELLGNAQRQIHIALKQADGILWICSAREGVLPSDTMILERLRKLGKPITCAANKLDDSLDVPSEFYDLGIHPVFPISALHGRGTGELLDHLVQRSFTEKTSQSSATQEKAQVCCRVVLVGRRNVGKSSLLNALCHQERALVSPIPGTTRDAIEVELNTQGTSVFLTDTAGLRHRRKVKSPIDFFSMSRSIEALEHCDVALVVLDISEDITRDDHRAIHKALDAGCGIILLINKWDLRMAKAPIVSLATRSIGPRNLRDAMKRHLPEALGACVLTVSAKSGFHLKQIVPLTLQMHRTLQQGLPDEALLDFLQSAWQMRPPRPIRGALRPRLLHVRWRGGRPVRLELTTRPRFMASTEYQRYLLNYLHRDERLSGIPLELLWNS